MLSLYQTMPRSAPARKTKLPGFGLPVNHVPKKNDPDFVDELFPSALSTKAIEDGAIAQPITTLRELTMLQFMDSITDKHDWHIKVKDETIAQKWKDEGIALDLDITQKMADWCINELRYKATLIPSLPALPPPMFVYNGDVYKSDTAVSPELKTRLQEAVIAFEKKIPLKQRDWHPQSEGKVWDLVHPSLFPLVYGRTRVLANGEKTTLGDCVRSCGKGETAPVPPAEDICDSAQKDVGDVSRIKKPFSAKFQWLPCEVDISGEEAKITTYINNLHPEEHELYTVIEKLITASIPLWELTLAPLRGFKERKHRIPYVKAAYDPDPTLWPDEDEGPEQESDEEDEDYIERRKEWMEESRVVIRPEPAEEFEPIPVAPKLDLRERFGSRGLQVIVKLANIELTPKKSKYNGGSWHVEGQLNEHIIATSLYYYSSSNITTSTLAFRHQCNAEDASYDVSYPQDAHDWLPDVFGCEQEGAAIQELGEVETREGRLLTFPNILQHRVGPFKLQDRKKPGHRKIVALFLVDPNIKVISTAHVPSQRQDWWWDLTRTLTEENKKKKKTKVKGVTDLPLELQDHIVDQLDDADFPISLTEAKKARLELMKERKAYVVQNTKAFEEGYTFSLCEH